jgi:DNA mismatch endonuclease, patch repair protein
MRKSMTRSGLAHAASKRAETGSAQRKHVPLPETSVRMRGVRQRDTKPELVLRRLLHSAGVRFRVCAADLPGSPDLSNKRAGWCVFVHGCFWHGHRGCKLARLPRTNTAWWEAKILANRRRDARKTSALRRLGFHVVTVWQCQLEHPKRVLDRLGTLQRSTRQKRGFP